MYIQKAKRFHYNSLERSVEVAGDSVKGDSFKVLKCSASAAAASVVSAFGSPGSGGSVKITTTMKKRVTLYKHNVFKFSLKQSVKSTVLHRYAKDHILYTLYTFVQYNTVYGWAEKAFKLKTLQIQAVRSRWWAQSSTLRSLLRRLN